MQSSCSGLQLCTGQEGHVSKAELCKAQANEAFKAQDFDGAIAGYTGAIQADRNNPVYFSNRAMAYLKVPLLPGLELQLARQWTASAVATTISCESVSHLCWHTCPAC